MFVPEEAWLALEKKYGTPKNVSLGEEMQDGEWALLRHSMRDGRKHDVTVFILKEGRIVVIKKHMHPKGVWRAPSGGVHHGEGTEEGIKREMREETGCTITVLRYILRIDVTFTHGDEKVEWTSHVFSASCLEDRFKPTDTYEIKSVRLATPDELRGSIRQALLASGLGGLIYRAKLTDLALHELGL
jgi:ADP-ribose pyrophosphatase YjhB (NUDIX family)